MLRLTSLQMLLLELLETSLVFIQDLARMVAQTCTKFIVALILASYGAHSTPREKSNFTEEVFKNNKHTNFYHFRTVFIIQYCDFQERPMQGQI